MAIQSIRCPVLGTQVTRVRDFEGAVTRVICTEYEGSSGRCRLKKASYEGGPLSQLLRRAAADAMDNRSTACVLIAN
jgi:hypothetical protein